MSAEPLTELDQADRVIRRLSAELKMEQVKMYLAYLGVDKSYYARKECNHA